MPADPQPQPEQDQRQLVRLLDAIAERETTRLHTGTLPWTWLLDRAAAYGQYGFTNTLLIAGQYRLARDVRSYDQWKSQGRQVLKGEHGIRIISRTGRPRAVFDVSQTEGPPLPERPAPEAAEVFADLRRLATRRTFFVDRRDNRWPAAAGRTISIEPELTDLRAVEVLAHQIGHLLLHHEQFDRDSHSCHGVRRAEADSIAYLFLARTGLDTSALSFPPVTTWAGSDPRARPLRTITTVGDRILRTATRIRKELDALPPAPLPKRTREPAREPAPTPAPVRTVAAAAPAPAPISGLASTPVSGARPPTSGVRRTNGTRPGSPAPADLIAIHAAAHRLFRTQLSHSWVPPYLSGRGFDQAVQHAWEIGYAPKSGRLLTDHLRRLGFTDDAILASGIARRARGSALFDTFRNRAMLPLRDPDGTITGFIGRLPDGVSGPKYLNSPETPIFRKGRLLFGLYETRDRLAGGARPVLVEGPFDAIAINTASPLYSAISPCGTAFTAQQLDALDQAADLNTTGLLLALDGDQPGRGAAVRVWETIQQVTGPLGVIEFAENLDPADLFDHHGYMAVRKALQSETPLADVVVDAAIERHGDHLEFAEGKVAAARAAASVIVRLPLDQVAHQVARVAAALGIAPAIVTDVLIQAVSPDPSDAAQLAGDGFPFPPLTSSTGQAPRATARRPTQDRPGLGRSA